MRVAIISKRKIINVDLEKLGLVHIAGGIEKWFDSYFKNWSGSLKH
jgi:hypothetical protein